MCFLTQHNATEVTSFEAGVDNKGYLPLARLLKITGPTILTNWRRTMSGIDPHKSEKEHIKAGTFYDSNTSKFP